MKEIDSELSEQQLKENVAGLYNQSFYSPARPQFQCEVLIVSLSSQQRACTVNRRKGRLLKD